MTQQFSFSENEKKSNEEFIFKIYIEEKQFYEKILAILNFYSNNSSFFKNIFFNKKDVENVAKINFYLLRLSDFEQMNILITNYVNDNWNNLSEQTKIKYSEMVNIYTNLIVVKSLVDKFIDKFNYSNDFLLATYANGSKRININDVYEEEDYNNY